MPTITDSEGNVVAKLPYDSEGEAQAEKLVEANPDLEIDYGENFIAALKKDNIFGIQPHPEKSQRQGLQIIKNFIES